MYSDSDEETPGADKGGRRSDERRRPWVSDLVIAQRQVDE